MCEDAKSVMLATCAQFRNRAYLNRGSVCKTKRHSIESTFPHLIVTTLLCGRSVRVESLEMKASTSIDDFRIGTRTVFFVRRADVGFTLSSLRTLKSFYILRDWAHLKMCIHTIIGNRRKYKILFRLTRVALRLFPSRRRKHPDRRGINVNRNPNEGRMFRIVCA